ncbi:hypothetical protein B9T24_08905 [Acinetobacter sp. ANC 4654]|uniref:hypothetical protein n=1 Tax=Acinetobacter sp. ANC 4654 TaxID=1977872 RepID=UPI000A351793|nr:hypothetical protein [Acinetobacter sp. ANC 4654]OTG95874.1 hypothetical protein B9T24_08905 [Acinetobacter sp. ANC 4654]
MLLNKYIKYTFLATTITTLLTACAGSDGSNNSSTTPFAPKSISGAAVDFYLKNATVKFDDCNGLTTTTDLQGQFSFETTADCNNSAITITGGTDIGTGLPFTGTLKIKKTDLQNISNNDLVASPLTSLEYYLGSGDLQVVLNNLGLTTVTAANIKSYNPVTDGSAKEMAVIFTLQQLATQIEDNFQAINKSDGSVALTQEQATQIAFSTIASALKTQGKNLFNSNGELQATALTDILTAAVTMAGTTINDPSVQIDPNIQGNISGNITTVSTEINKIAQSGGKGEDLQAALNVALQDPNSPAQAIKESLKTPIYADFTLAGYSLAELKASTAAPLALSHANLSTALAVNFKLNNTKSELTDTIKLGFKLDGSRGAAKENLDVIIHNIQVTFKQDGTILSAKIPSNTKVNIASTLKDVTQLEFITQTDIVINVSNGSIPLASVVSSSPTLQKYYNLYIDKLAVNDLVQASAYVLPITYTVDPALGLQNDTINVNGIQFQGSSLVAHFKLN